MEQLYLSLLLIGIANALHMKAVNDIKDELNALFEANDDDVAPFVYLSWHDAGTYDSETDTGGSRACQRLTSCGEAEDSHNNGLEIPIRLLEPIHEKWASVISYADLWALAGATAIEYAGGPDISFNYGRIDCLKCQEGTLGRLPDADSNHEQLVNIFTRMGFEDPEEALVVLSGAHSLGNCETANSGYEGMWTTKPTKLENGYFQNLYERTEQYQNETTKLGNQQFRNPDDNTIMLPSDMALLDDEVLEERVEEYADDNKEFRLHFAHYFQKLQELHWEGSEHLKGVAKLIVYEDFSDWDTYKKDWSDNGVEPSQLVGGGGAGTNTSLTVEGTGSPLGDNQGIFYALDSPTEISNFECWFHQSKEGAQYDSGVHITDNSGKHILNLEIAVNQFRIPGEYTDVKVGNIPPGSWVKVAITFDWETRTMATHVTQETGEIETTEDIPFYNSGAKKAKTIRFFHWTDLTIAGFDEFLLTGKSRNAVENEYPGTILAGAPLLWWIILLICIGGVCFCICVVCCIVKARKEKEPPRESTKV